MNRDNLEQLDMVDLLMSHRTRQDSMTGSGPTRHDLAKLYADLETADRGVVDRLVEETEKIRRGHHAFDLANDLLRAGEVERARHWLSVAAESDIEDAVSLLGEDTAGEGPAAGRVADPGVPVDEDVIIQALIQGKENAERALRDSEARFEEVFTTSSVGMAISGLDGILIRTNRAFAEILGHHGNIVAGKLEEIFHPEDADYLRLRYEVLLDEISLPFRERRRLLRTDGEEALVFLSASVLRDPDGSPRYYVTTVEDVSDRHFLEGQLQFLATHDSLTGLLNRQRFLRRLEETLVGEHIAAGVSVFHLNLDGFRAINNGLGRDVGDRLLQVVSTRLRQVFAGETATLARLDGDEFGVLLEASPTTPSIPSLATRINDELGEPIYIGDQGIATTVSIAVVPRLSANSIPEELLRATDTALQRLKAAGRRQWGVVDADENERDRDRFMLASSVPGAWENGEIDLDFQPLVSVADRSIVAVQALLRWDHAERGQLDPQQCQEVLTETGLALPIGRWMLRNACEQLHTWICQYNGVAPKLYVELTKELAGDPDLVSTVQQALTDSALSPKQLQLGMPVPALCVVDGLAEDNLDVLVDLGIDVVLYEFGTTRGDLACLEDLPICAVKMSRRVVSRVTRMGDDALFTRATRQLIPLIRETGIPVIVGTVDTQDQLDWWRDAGADMVQGAVNGLTSYQQRMSRVRTPAS